ncbi:hypothetical protein RWV98_02900 [Agathobaculum sp. NTUH-O15-33]|uniref:hypothetical protein n=1 Tax=Agathobaculum sp. NTUH-O15-33 TaxID=3079302 RepID=UPI002958A5CD|nr:hypothetical protein [Agathobaculum sp. NTUH-O15-33]WNX85241.1 hypothetical protein RWV98_02900 [Agathobaculum sp. NTUH-O15-33]
MIKFLSAWAYVFTFVSISFGFLAVSATIARLSIKAVDKLIYAWVHLSAAGKNVLDYLHNRNEYNRWKREQNREN